MSPNFWTRADPGAEWAGVEFVAAAAAAAASAGPESPDLRALVQGVSNGRVIGHALRRSAPEQRLELEVVVDGDVVARGPADVFRQALLDEKLADGSCGFSIELPDSLQGAARLRFLVREAVSHAQLPVSPTLLVRDAVGKLLGRSDLRADVDGIGGAISEVSPAEGIAPARPAPGCHRSGRMAA